MAWGDTTILRKFIRYAREYADWATVTEVSRPVPRTLAARIEAPFFTQEVFLDRYHWWIASYYDTDIPILNAPPRHLSPVDILEADLMILVAHDYLTSLALALGSRNELLIPDDYSATLRKEDDRGARVDAFANVVRYLEAVANGVNHRNPTTQQLAQELLRVAQPTLIEFASGADQGSTPEATPPQEPSTPIAAVEHSQRAERTSLEQFQNAMRSRVGRRNIGIDMSDAEGERIASDPVLAQAYYQSWVAERPQGSAPAQPPPTEPPSSAITPHLHMPGVSESSTSAASEPFPHARAILGLVLGGLAYLLSGGWLSPILAVVSLTVSIPILVKARGAKGRKGAVAAFTMAIIAIFIACIALLLGVLYLVR